MVNPARLLVRCALRRTPEAAQRQTPALLVARSFSSHPASSPSSNNVVRPRASNYPPKHFGQARKPRPKRPAGKTSQSSPAVPPPAPGSILAEHLKAAGEQAPQTSWVRVENIPPLSSLDAMIRGIVNALEQQQERGILDLDAPWDPNKHESVPFLQNSFNNNSNNDATTPSIIRKAHIILSPFGRPMGWHVQLENRSLAHALLTQAKENKVLCAWKPVTIQPAAVNNNNTPPRPPTNVSDATVRVENCPPSMTVRTLMNILSRYDLRAATSTTHDDDDDDSTTSSTSNHQKEEPAIVPWHVQQLQGTNVPLAFLVHFADASWARAAVREKQSYYVKGKELRLIQFPKQIL